MLNRERRTQRQKIDSEFLNRYEYKHRHSVEQLYRMAFTDTLTGLKNRNWWNSESELIYTDIVKKKRLALTIVFMDLDNFAYINEQAGGEAVADRILRTIGGLFLTPELGGFREEDVVVRLGGDEFGALQVGTSIVDAIGAAKRVQRSIVEITGEKHHLPVSLSVGISSSSISDVASADDLYRTASIAKSNAKRDRGSIVTYTVGMQPYTNYKR